MLAHESDEYDLPVDAGDAPSLGCLLPVAAFVLAVIASVAFAERPDKELPPWPTINRPYQLTTGLTNDLVVIALRGQAAEARLELLEQRLAPASVPPGKVGPDVELLEIIGQEFRDEGPLFEIASTGKPLRIVCRDVTTHNCGPLLVTRGEAFDGMRPVSIEIDRCRVDCGYRSKGLHLESVAIDRLSIERSTFTRCEKAGIQIGAADLHQPRRANITIRDTLIDGILDREGSDSESHGIFLLACQDVTLDGVAVRNVASREGRDVDCEGIYLKARDVLILNPRLRDAGLSAITIKGVGEADPDASHCRYGDRVTVRGAEITTTEAYRELPTRGVLIDCGGSVTVDGCSIRGGVVIDQPDGATGDIVVSRNTITDPGGLAVEVRKASRPLTIVGNVGIGVRKSVGARVWPDGSINAGNAGGEP